MKESIFLLTIIFVICMTLSFMLGEDKGHRDYYKGKAECTEVFDKLNADLNLIIPRNI